MTRLNDEMLRRAAGFVWLTARTIEQRRFVHLFGGGDARGVLAALAAFKTSDGGYAFGLEPDVRGPDPQPLAMTTALHILAEAGALDQAAGAEICDWLAAVSPTGAPAVLPSLANNPHPPFLPVPPAGRPVPPDLLCTGQLTGPLLAHGVTHPWLDAAVGFCWDAVARIETTHPYEAHAALDFLDHAPDRPRAEAEAARLGRLVRDQRLVPLDPADPSGTVIAQGYAPGEYHYATDYARTPGSLAARWFSDTEIARSLDFLATRQQEDGGWPITYAQWSPVTAIEARPGATLTALKTLRAWDGA